MHTTRPANSSESSMAAGHRSARPIRARWRGEMRTHRAAEASPEVGPGGRPLCRRPRADQPCQPDSPSVIWDSLHSVWLGFLPRVHEMLTIFCRDRPQLSQSVGDVGSGNARSGATCVRIPTSTSILIISFCRAIKLASQSEEKFSWPQWPGSLQHRNTSFSTWISKPN
jgi:hypothetical protein